MGNRAEVMPFSGDVSQIINPWTFWLKSLTQQSGFININNIKSGDSEIERQIVEDVASYGRQLGWLIEVLNIIVNRYELKDLTEEEDTSMGQFFDLIKKTEEIKQKINQSKGIKQKLEHHMLTSGQLNLMIEDIRAWEKIDKTKFNDMVSRIKSAFP
jgi:hypothetical protein